MTTLHHPSHTPDTPLTLALPLDFTAFCELHHHHYQRYARTRITDPATAQHAVHAALGDIAMRWPHLLASPSPAACAWHLLKHRIRQHTTNPRDSGHNDDLADTALLHHTLHLTDTDIAHVTGTPLHTVRYQLHTTHHPPAPPEPQTPMPPPPGQA
ncbi:hypothetical protein [Peterkaempfera bronchialis]|uniref:hypothetical protein n=1 Tax=Peterkaempfera bronchialis TaxID=2126346 RepID=UPI003C30AC79